MGKNVRRKERLNEQFRREISRILREEVRDPRVGLPTITEVAVTPDLWLARIYVRPDPTQLGSPESEEELMKGLEDASPFVRRTLGQLLRIRRVPELRFLPDHTLEQALRIERILREVMPEGGDEGEGEDTDSPGEEEAKGGPDGSPASE